MVDTPELEDQDQAEVLDETNLTRDGEDIANFDDIADVEDLTTALGDEDEDAENADADADADGDPRDLVDEFSDGDDEEGAMRRSTILRAPAWKTGPKTQI